jgi:acyl-[acyl-carrier-protein]-phospholipid O-acyltransferase / long-chain-fatty-acid--[acyl-carrier-protein] ligase
MKSFFKKRPGSFTYLNATQFLGALNDNVFKFLIIFFLIDMQGINESPRIMAFAGGVFVIPFLIFSTTSGKMADRFSKRNIIVFSKALEVIVMALGIVAFALSSTFGAYSILFLMATQSAIFSPSKYGIVPELVSYEKLSQANGLLTTFTFLAIIAGTFLAGFITDLSGRNFVLSSLFCIVISLVGFWTSLQIEFTPPAGTKKKLSFFLSEVYRTLLAAKQHNRLYCAMWGSAFFLFMGAYMQLNIIPFAIQSLDLTDVHGSYLFLITAIGIGTGSAIAGKLSGKHVELGLAPIAGMGMVICCCLLYLFPSRLTVVAPVVLLTGMFGGIWVVPFDSFIQAYSPDHARGQMVAATNFLGFMGVLCASAMIYILSEILNLQAYQGFLIMGIICLIITVIITIATLDYFLRFISHSISKNFFSLSTSGYDNVPKQSPSLILCDRPSSLIDTLLLTGIQRPPLRFLIESENYQNIWTKRFFKLFRIVLIPPHYFVNERQKVCSLVKAGLDKGFTVCIFTKVNEDDKSVSKNYLDEFYKFFEHTPYFIIPVTIDEKPLHPESGKLLDLIKEFPWSVKIAFGAIQKPTDN